MNIISSAVGGAFEKRSAASGVSKMNSGFFPAFSFSGDKVIKPIHHKEALTLPALYNAVDVLSDSHGVIPYFVFEKTDMGRERRREHAVDFMLNEEPDGQAGILSPFNFKKLIVTSVKLRGNCLFRIHNHNNGDMSVSYIDWSDVQDIRWAAETGYTYHVRGLQPLFSYEVLHYRGHSLDGVVGVSALAYAAINMGMAIELQKFSYTLSEAKGVRQGVLETDKAMPTGKDQIITGVRTALGERSSDRFIVLDEGMKYKPITVTPQEAQLVEAGRFSIEDMARWMNIPLYKIKSLTQSTNNNVEQMAIDYVVDSIQPIVTMVEQENQRKLLTRAERIKSGRYIKGNMAALIRGTMQVKGEFYSKMVNSGIYTVNEVRAFEEMNAMEGGDVLRFPVNTQTQEQIDKSLKDE